ncbi:hypothetical protein FRZ61_23950 [Hypericibacter adhaerens]|jgi:hypothetical protein|uniref:Sulfotransferase n=1 Tax=Hypericibacter adhaerens TaxID=2602016 RepID=A0A5J6MZK9_9PROT|nr:sulfotransferase [Hypericibacter adhaerens]QEX22464.1 hypothetical protein FRZ61_23950 [Hypericibacter adhaerens]
MAATEKPPVFVIGPTTRCGTSLLQRLLNSTGRIVVYGENFALLQTFPDIIRNYQREADAKRKVIAMARDLLVEKKEDFEASSLFPDFDSYLRALIGSFRLLLRSYRDDAAALGFERWGIKHQIRSQTSFAILPRLLPDARYVMIYRDLLPVARSAKARWPGDFRGPQDWRRFARNWADNIRTMQRLSGDAFLLLKYENFTADPEPHLQRLERFVEIDGIDRAVMTRRINDQPRFAPDGSAVTGYRPPQPLSDEETDLMMSECAAFYRELGYGAAG